MAREASSNGQLQRRSSFISDSNFTFDHSSEFYTATSSGNTIRGPGALSGAALKAFGKIVLRTADDIAVHLRIASIRSKTGFLRSEWDDLLEPEAYNTSIRQRAFSTLLIGIESQTPVFIFSDTEDSLVSRVLKLPLTEIEIFVSGMIACLPDDRLDYLNRPVLHENVRSIFATSSPIRKRLITMQFSVFLQRLASRELSSGFFELDKLLGLSPDIDGRLLNSAIYSATPSLDLDSTHLLKFVAMGDPMWTKLGTFLRHCRPGDDTVVWSRMIDVVMQPSSWAFYEYKERVRRYRDVEPILYFTEFCTTFCPDSMERFSEVGLQTFFLGLLRDFSVISDDKLNLHEYSKLSDHVQQRAVLNKFTQRLLDFMRRDYNGGTDIDLNQEYIGSVCLIALLVMSPISRCKDDASRTRYQTCVGLILLFAMEDLETWASNVSFRNVFGAGSDLDPNVLLIVFRALEKLYKLPELLRKLERRSYSLDLSSLTLYHILKDIDDGPKSPPTAEQDGFEYLLNQLLALNARGHFM
ncbi:hypothetical protein D9758_004021 [Tetrapyrgos nigripes]|uniref:Uncharacterized protein n=1 Tax=Tetrapyrgos nigripes TaxID=182062 RepID=A0A8H5GL88_9AGAR|nr:hypothetical protein D9758_004021 [Tetrapyrgos nigripes]